MGHCDVVILIEGERYFKNGTNFDRVNFFKQLFELWRPVNNKIKNFTVEAL